MPTDMLLVCVCVCVCVCVHCPFAARLMLLLWWLAGRPSAPTWLWRRMGTVLSWQRAPTATCWPAAAGV
jgi:hypothetical protein